MSLQTVDPGKVGYELAQVVGENGHNEVSGCSFAHILSFLCTIKYENVEQIISNESQISYLKRFWYL